MAVFLAVSAAVVLALTVLLGAVLRAARQTRGLAQQIQLHVEPYLKRKASECGLLDSAPVWTSRSRPEEIVAYSTGLADRLLERERTGTPFAPPNEEALAATQPVDPKAHG